jgi:NhaP-type Na+/H+ or K+/H+ antiporter
LYGLEAYHILLAALGLAIILAFWLPRFISGREPATSTLLILFGLITFTFIPGMPEAIGPVEHPRPWELLAELCVIVGLFGTGLRIDRLAGRKQWMPTLRLLLFAMPATILMLALAGWAIAGMTLAGGLLLGAVLAPTDPVLAGDVQVGPPHEGGEHPVRYTLTTEAGLNDGLAFPFVHLGILVVAAGAGAGAGAGEFGLWTAGEWLIRDVFYRVLIGGLGGVAVGWFLGKVLFEWPSENALSKTGSGVVALAGVLLAYGVTEMAEGYGFIAAFIAGYTLRRSETEHEFHRRLHDFSESIEHALTAMILVGLGAAMPMLWPHLDWRHISIALLLVFLIRPLAAWVSLRGTPLPGRDRLVVAFYGVRGVGSVYYLAYAGHHVELVNEHQLWATIAFTILLSTVVHGLTAGIAVERVTGGEDAKPSEPEASPA